MSMEVKGQPQQTQTQQPKDWDANLIIENLYLGSAVSAMGLSARDAMKSVGVAGIVNVTEKKQGLSSQYVNDFEYYNIDVADATDVDLGKYFDQACEFIHKHRSEKKAVLVHCMAGASRSATIVMAYLMKHERMTLEKAYTHVISCRACVDPNDAFRRQLMAKEKMEFSCESPTIDLIQQNSNYLWRSGSSIWRALTVWPQIQWIRYKGDGIPHVDNHNTDTNSVHAVICATN